MLEEQLTELKATQTQSTELVEKQQVVIANLESLQAEQKKVLTEITEELGDLTRKEKEARERAEQINKAFMRSNEKVLTLESDVEQLQIRLEKQKTLALQGGGGLKGVNGDANLDVQYLQMKARKWDDRMKCSICKEREKDTILQNCLHMFCNECVRNIYSSRSRKCPIDGGKFTDQEYKKIPWGENDV